MWWILPLQCFLQFYSAGNFIAYISRLSTLLSNILFYCLLYYVTQFYLIIVYFNILFISLSISISPVTKTISTRGLIKYLILILESSGSPTASKNMCIMSACLDFTQLWLRGERKCDFYANCWWSTLIASMSCVSQLTETTNCDNNKLQTRTDKVFLMFVVFLGCLFSF